MITAYTAELNAGDYVEVYVYQNSGDAQTATNNYFTGHKLIGA
jgi:predicted RNA-binding protein (virulence factor B family)